MTLRELILEKIPANEIKVRVNNKQLKLNQVSLSLADLQQEVGNKELKELGDFVYENLYRIPESVKRRHINLRDFFGTEPTNYQTLAWVTEYHLLTLSKREEYVLVKKNWTLSEKLYSENDLDIRSTKAKLESQGYNVTISN